MTTPSPAIPFKRILAAVDGSDHGLYAARAARTPPKSGPPQT